MLFLLYAKIGVGGGSAGKAVAPNNLLSGKKLFQA